MLKDELLFAWWTLSSIQGIGSIALNKIREQLPHCSALAECSAQDLISMGLKSELALAWQQSKTSDDNLNPFVFAGWQKIQTWCQQPNCGVLLPDDKYYPEALAALRDAPIFLFYRGNPQLLNESSIAIVGSRNPTHYGREQAFTIAQQLVMSDWHVISGLAIGIDGEAHKGALNDSTGIGRGKTIAVLGSGLEEIYPKRHQDLADHIVMAGGVLLSEHLPDIKALAQHFPRRNRIVSGMSLGTLVIEAAYKSGSLITARLAAEQGREVFALPGAVTNPLSRGCHQLIKEGANLIENATDIINLINSDLAIETRAAEVESEAENQHDLFGGSAGQKAAGSVARQVEIAQSPVLRLEVPKLEGLAKIIYQALDVVPTSIDALVNRTGLSVAEIAQQLILMELKGHVAQTPGGYVRV
ncbi:MAG: DNA-processing protein DprA [Oleispira antarctica]|nr:DNA-processing protein DprA [Oleispira antarctica]MBQ0793304.1 DNA-processing protein DprA [Oleispira antarctica]|tara:strand:- start:127 stop:1371 length:1245 start_codon:yes stop_codon:yes gene_type:complete